MVAEHHPDALATLYDRHANAVYRLILRIVRDAPIADEILQETFWQVWQKAAQYNQRGEVLSWIFRIARNRSLDELRRQKVRPRSAETAHTDPHVLLSQMPAEEISVEQATELAWARRQVHQALSEVPSEQREAIELAFFEGLSHREIAHKTNTPIGTIKTRVRLGMQKLARSLGRKGYNRS